MTTPFRHCLNCPQPSACKQACGRAGIDHTCVECKTKFRTHHFNGRGARGSTLAVHDVDGRFCTLRCALIFALSQLAMADASSRYRAAIKRELDNSVARKVVASSTKKEGG